MRPAALLLAAAVALLLTAPVRAQAGEEVDLLDVRLPPLVAADVPFGASVTLENRLDRPVTAYLYAVLYRGEGGPCGAQTSERWRGVVSYSPGVAQVPLEAGEARTWPDPERREGVPPSWTWWWRVNLTQAAEGGAYEVCVFAMEQAGAALRDVSKHYDFLPATLQVRPGNEPPAADFAFAPRVANVTTPFRFEAQATDPDGDALTYRWDFGHFNAQGRATATGAVAEHRFYPHGTYDVTLEVRDLFDGVAKVTKSVTVLPEEEPTPEPIDPATETPGPGALAALVGVVVVHLARRR